MKSYKKCIEDGDFLEKKVLSDGTIIFKVKGTFGPEDFRVRAYNPNTNFKLQPKHAHFGIDFYGKLCSNKDGAIEILNSINDIWHKIPIEELLKRYKNKVKDLPGYSIEYILHALNWILDQEDINFKGRSNEMQRMLDEICKKFNIITPKGREGGQITMALFCFIADGTHPVEAFIRLGLRI